MTLMVNIIDGTAYGLFGSIRRNRDIACLLILLHRLPFLSETRPSEVSPLRE